MKLVFLGSGAFGLPTLQMLHQKHEVRLVVTQPDRPAGRKMKLKPTDIALWAQAQGLPVLKVEDVNTPEMVQTISAHQPDASVVIAFGQKLSPDLIGGLGELAMNLHASLLPQYRGAAPIARAVMAGESHAGVSVISLAQKMDAGEVYATAQLPVGPSETTGELHDRLADLGPDVIANVLEQLQAGSLQPVFQDETQATRAPKFTKKEGTTDFDQPADAVRARVNGLNPWPGCTVNWYSKASGQTTAIKLKRVQTVAFAHAGSDGVSEESTQLPQEVLEAKPGTVFAQLPGWPDWCVRCGDDRQIGLIQLLELQAAGTKVMPAEAFATGRQMATGDCLSLWQPVSDQA